MLIFRRGKGYLLCRLLERTVLGTCSKKLKAGEIQQNPIKQYLPASVAKITFSGNGINHGIKWISEKIFVLYQLVKALFNY